jgi:hypothetical protein
MASISVSAMKAEKRNGVKWRNGNGGMAVSIGNNENEIMAA